MQSFLERKCSVCSKVFKYENGRGKHSKQFCSLDCKSFRKKELAKKYSNNKKQNSDFCKITGCRGKATRKDNVCENHYCKMRRTGSYAGLIRSQKAVHGNYIRMVGNGASQHPMASKNSKMLYEHRMVAYDSREGKCEDCFWCGKELTWSSCVIDHLNELKHDNSPENLLISCRHCNRARGALLGFVRRMKEESLSIFWNAILEYRKTNVR